MIYKKYFQPKIILYLFVLINLILGLFIVSDYGTTIDEFIEEGRTKVTLSIYTSTINENPFEEYQKIRHNRYYGTASNVIYSFIQNVLLKTGYSAIASINYGHFVFFQAAIILIFYLGKYFFDEWISLGVAILFGTQPLLIGHAFINSKDIALLTTFLFVVVNGFRMVDRWMENDAQEEKNIGDNSVDNEIREGQAKRRYLVILIFFSLFLVLWLSPWITSLIQNIVEYSYNTKGTSFLGKMFAAVTTYGSLEGYLTLIHLYILEVYRWISFGTPILLFFLFYYVQKNQLFGKYVNLFLLLGAAGWGFAISTRVMAIAAGGMVGLYALIKVKEKAIFPLIVYILTASIISYITWPFLWVYGFQGYLESLSILSDFPWFVPILFEGEYFLPHDLPNSYIPKLMMLQFTEPLVIFTLIGLLIGLYLFYKKTIDTHKLLLLYAWCFMPMLYVMIGEVTVYNNFRHFLFITPPLFVFSGFAFQQIVLRLKKKVLLVVISVLILLPGLIGIVQVHPFQYMYYNAFIGGIEGVYNSYQLNYWSAGYKEAMDYVNENIPSNSKIMIWKNNLFGEVYAENTYLFEGHTAVPVEEYGGFDYAIIPGKQIETETPFSNYPVIYSVDVDNVSLVVIVKITDDAD